MRTAALDGADPTFPVSIVERPDPELPGAGWARIEVRHGGICGSDLHVLRPDGTSSPVYGPYVGHPMEMGHEIGGVVVEAGPACPVPAGTPVAVDPIVACVARGLDPCPRCRAGELSSCLRLSERVVTPGMGLGFTTGLGSGWGDRLLAHATQLHPAPPGVDERSVPLTEPLSIAIHGLLRRPPADGAPALVVGAGMIGLAAVAALRALVPSSPVTVVARHDHQAEVAARLGAANVVRSQGDDLMDELAELSGARRTGRGDGAMLAGGFPVVVEAVGSAPSVDLVLKACAQRGVIHLMGAVGRLAVDLTPLYFKELDVVGTFCHAVDAHHGDSRHSFDRALDVIAAGGLTADHVVTHVFPLDDLREAVETALARDAGAIKVLLRP